MTFGPFAVLGQELREKTLPRSPGTTATAIGPFILSLPLMPDPQGRRWISSFNRSAISDVRTFGYYNARKSRASDSRIVVPLPIGGTGPASLHA